MSEELEMLDEEYTPELIDLEDEEGNLVTFEIIDGMEFEGNTYYALIPYTEEESDETEDEFVILKEIIKEGESFLTSIDSDEENDRIGAAFLERFLVIFGDEE